MFKTIFCCHVLQTINNFLIFTYIKLGLVHAVVLDLGSAIHPPPKSPKCLMELVSAWCSSKNKSNKIYKQTKKPKHVLVLRRCSRSLRRDIFKGESKAKWRVLVQGTWNVSPSCLLDVIKNIFPSDSMWSWRLNPGPGDTLGNCPP